LTTYLLVYISLVHVISLEVGCLAADQKLICFQSRHIHQLYIRWHVHTSFSNDYAEKLYLTCGNSTKLQIFIFCT